MIASEGCALEVTSVHYSPRRFWSIPPDSPVQQVPSVSRIMEQGNAELHAIADNKNTVLTKNDLIVLEDDSDSHHDARSGASRP
jgi:hypothetical protein